MRRIVVLLALFALLLVAPSRAIEVDATSTAESINGNATTHNHPTATDANLILVCPGARDTALNVQPHVSVTVGGSAATFVDGAQSPDNEVRTEIWAKLAPATGTVQIIVTPHATSETLSTTVISLKGVALAGAFNTPATAGANSGTNLDLNGLPSALGELGVLCGIQKTNSPTVSADATSPVSVEQLEYAHTNSTSHITFIYTEAGAAGTIDMRVNSDTSAEWALAGVSVRPLGRNRPAVLLP